MRISVLSDIHDNIWKLEKVLERVAGAGALIFCGDLCAPFTLAQIAESFSGPVHVVWGNNDGDKFLLTRNAIAAVNVTLHGELAELNLSGKRIAINHYPQIARPIAKSGEYDAVFYGHDHTARVEQMGETLLLNPGEVMGHYGRSTFGWYETETGSGEIVEVV